MNIGSTVLNSMGVWMGIPKIPMCTGIPKYRYIPVYRKTDMYQYTEQMICTDYNNKIILSTFLSFPICYKNWLEKPKNDFLTHQIDLKLNRKSLLMLQPHCIKTYLRTFGGVFTTLFSHHITLAYAWSINVN